MHLDLESFMPLKLYQIRTSLLRIYEKGIIANNKNTVPTPNNVTNDIVSMKLPR
jgi:uncharacterized membrane protein